MISPWVTLVSDQHANTKNDYLDDYQLGRYAETSPARGSLKVTRWYRPGAAKILPSTGFMSHMGRKKSWHTMSKGFWQCWRRQVSKLRRGEGRARSNPWLASSLFFLSKTIAWKGCNLLSRKSVNAPPPVDEDETGERIAESQIRSSRLVPS